MYLGVIEVHTHLFAHDSAAILRLYKYHVHSQANPREIPLDICAHHIVYAGGSLAQPSSIPLDSNLTAKTLRELSTLANDDHGAVELRFGIWEPAFGTMCGKCGTELCWTPVRLPVDRGPPLYEGLMVGMMVVQRYKLSKSGPSLVKAREQTEEVQNQIAEWIGTKFERLAGVGYL
jgi:hypothetical protein